MINGLAARTKYKKVRENGDWKTNLAARKNEKAVLVMLRKQVEKNKFPKRCDF